MAMKIDFSAFNGNRNTRICFSPDILSYMQIKNNAATIPSKYDGTQDETYFLQIYSQHINKNQAWEREHGPGINFKRYTGVDIDDYPYIASHEMYVGGGTFNLPFFNFPNGVTHPYISESNKFNGSIGYSDMAYDFSEMFLNCTRFCNVFGYPTTMLQQGGITNVFAPFRNHYTSAEKEMEIFNLNYSKINAEGRFPGYNCSNMFKYCLSYKMDLIPLTNTTQYGIWRSQYQLTGMNRLNWVMLKSDGVGIDGPAINDASCMFYSADITPTGSASLYPNFDIYVNNAESMFKNCNLNASYLNINVVDNCENMFNHAVIRGNPVVNTSEIYSLSMSNMFSYATMNPSSEIVIRSSIRNTSHMFHWCNGFNVPVNVMFPTEDIPLSSRLIDMSSMFASCTLFNHPVNIPNSVTNTHDMFAWCNNFNQPMFVNSGVADCSSMFYGCYNLNSPVHIASQDIVNAYSMFHTYLSSTIGPSPSLLVTIDSTHIGRAIEMFGRSKIVQGPNFTNQITIDNAQNMFYQCNYLQSVNLYNVSINVATSMFRDCLALSDVIFHDDGYHVNNAYKMFENSGINNASIKPFGARITSELEFYGEMFIDCNNLDDLHLYDRNYANNNYRGIVRYNASRLLNVYLHCADDRSVVLSEMTTINSKRDVMPYNTAIGAASYGYLNNAWTVKPNGIHTDNNYPNGCWRDTRYNINLYLVPDM